MKRYHESFGREDILPVCWIGHMDWSKIKRNNFMGRLLVRILTLPQLSVKISVDYGYVQVVLYGKSIDRSHIDIVGSSISVAAKMIPLAQTWQIVIGQSMYENLDSKENLIEMNLDPTRWTYVDEKTGNSYKLYTLT
jgi:class 3 adenylate cyclase